MLSYIEIKAFQLNHVGSIDNTSMIKLFFIQKLMCLISVLNYLNTYRHKQNCSRLVNLCCCSY